MSEFYIYKISCKDPLITDCYVGSTMNIITRITKHKNDVKTSNLKIYKFIREHGGWDNWKYEVIHHDYYNKNLMLYYEYKFINLLNSTLNSIIPKLRSYVKTLIKEKGGFLTYALNKKIRQISKGDKYLNEYKNYWYLMRVIDNKRYHIYRGTNPEEIVNIRIQERIRNITFWNTFF